MSPRVAAGRYARALLDVALQEADPAKVEQDLSGFVDVVRQHPSLHHVLVNPAIPAARKRAVVDELTKRSPAMTPVVRKLLVMLAERDRLVLLDELLRGYRDRLMEHQQVVRAEVTTAIPLPHDRASALEQSLSATTGKRVSLSTRVDPAILGGVVAKIGSVVYDGSVARQLERMRERLVEE